MLAVEKHVPENWVRLYIKRWLEASVFTVSGELIQKQGKGTPQEGVISPLLANLFLHYAFDKWLEKTDKSVQFSRYADDVIIHCKSKVHAERILNFSTSTYGIGGIGITSTKDEACLLPRPSKKRKTPRSQI